MASGTDLTVMSGYFAWKAAMTLAKVLPSELLAVYASAIVMVTGPVTLGCGAALLAVLEAVVDPPPAQADAARPSAAIRAAPAARRDRVPETLARIRMMCEFSFCVVEGRGVLCAGTSGRRVTR